MGSPGVVEAGELAKPAHWRLKITFWLDVMLLISACALYTVPFTGLVVHEWLGLAMLGMVLAHLLLSWSWIASHSRRLFAVSARARINYVLNLSLFATVIAAIFSGILISQQAVPALTGNKAALDMDCALGLPSHPVLGIYAAFVRLPPGDQLGMGARGRTKDLPSAPSLTKSA